MFEEIGHSVEKIRRVGYGPLVLDLEPGNLRELDAEELAALRLAAAGKLKPRRMKTTKMLPKEAGRSAEKKFRAGASGGKPPLKKRADWKTEDRRSDRGEASGGRNREAQPFRSHERRSERPPGRGFQRDSGRSDSSYRAPGRDSTRSHGGFERREGGEKREPQAGRPPQRREGGFRGEERERKPFTPRGDRPAFEVIEIPEKDFGRRDESARQGFKRPPAGGGERKPGAGARREFGGAERRGPKAGGPPRRSEEGFRGPEQQRKPFTRPRGDKPAFERPAREGRKFEGRGDAPGRGFKRAPAGGGDRRPGPGARRAFDGAQRRGRPEGGERRAAGGPEQHVRPKPSWGEKVHRGPGEEKRPASGERPKPAYGKATYGKSGGFSRPKDGRGSRPSSGRPSSGRPSGGRSPSGRPSSGRPQGGGKPSSSGPKRSGGRPGGPRPGGKRPGSGPGRKRG